ncbi:hypothetical protein CVS27_17145 [Arthrobacter glacialis]|uniref:Uncharacterized protein n=1 Tax=Arthrobacter glacialis TaxID=1664 RepID=A0A2S3ZSJ4_ARTGL|nr:hypothetical protein CVS27_17145 [Arthrobacter glacialis]
MFRVTAVWAVVAVSGAMILPNVVRHMSTAPWMFAPMLALWTADLVMAAQVTHEFRVNAKREGTD